jgi:hypothetical protein
MSIVPRPIARRCACLRRIHLPRPAAAEGCRFSNQDNFPVPLQHTRPGGQRNIDFSDSTGRSRAVMRFHRWSCASSGSFVLPLQHEIALTSMSKSR